MSIATLTIDLVARLANIERDMAAATQIAQTNARKMEDAFDGVGNALKGLGAYLSADLLIGWVKGAVDAADRLDEMSERTGVAVEMLNGLSYAVQMSGGDMDSLEKGLQSINKRLSDFAAGDKATVEIFKALGISATDAEGALLQLADAFPQLDKTDQVRIGTELLGKAYASLVPLLAQGRAGLQELIAEGQRLNPITTESAKQAAEFNDNLERLRRSSDGLALSIGSTLIPALDDLANQYLDSKRAGLGFWESIAFLGTVGPAGSAAPDQQVARISEQLARLREAPWYKKSLAENVTGDDLIQSLERQLDYWQRQASRAQNKQNRELLSSFDDNPPGYTPGPGAPKLKLPSNADAPKAPRAAAGYTDPLADEAKAYEKIMLQLTAAQREADTAGLALTATQQKLLETMSAPEWLTMTDAMRAQIAQQGEATIAAEQRAEAEKRLQDLLTDSGLERQRADMQMLAQAYEDGRISVEQYSDAVQRSLGNVPATLDKTAEGFESLKASIEGWGKDAAAAIVDFAITGKSSFGDMINSMIADLARMVVQKNITAPLAATISGADYAAMGSAVAGFFGFAEGGVMTAGGPLPLRAYAAGGVASSPQLALFGEGSRPEAFVPLPDGRSIPVTMRGAGASVQVVVHNNAGAVAQASATATQDSAGNTQINIMVERVESMMGRRIQQGGGLAPMLENRYGLNPAAGARF